MKKIIIVILLILAIGGVYFIYSGNPNSGSNSEEVLRKMETILADQSENSLQLIDQALEEKKINYETALVYKTYAIFGDENLPTEYQSKALILNANPVLLELKQKFTSLSPETQSKLAPFLKRPNETDSYFNLHYGQNTSTQSSLLIQTAKATRPDANIYSNYLISADNRAKIWYPNITVGIYSPIDPIISTTPEASKIMAEKLKKYLDNDKIMQRYIDLLQKDIKNDGTRGGDDKLDIYVAPAGNDWGVTWGESATPCSSYILINITLAHQGDVLLKTVLAHEIFHAYQYAYKYDWIKDNWWGEATAVWAEDFIYPDANTEQTRLPEFLPYPDTELYIETPPSHHHYGAYIFPYFITKKYGNDFMKKSWEGCDGKDCLKSIDAIIDGGFKQQWKEFTLWNYNKAPAKFYTDQKGFSTISADSSSKKETNFMAATPLEFPIPELKPLSAHLNELVNALDDQKVKRLIFTDLKNFTAQSDKAAIKALIYYKNGQQKIEDWTNLTERSFCLENQDENLDRIILIFSNANMKDKIPQTTFKIESRDSCYHIDQKDQSTAVLFFPYSNAGVTQTAQINTSVEINSQGDPQTNADPDQKYGYLTKWRLNYQFEQIRQAFNVNCGSSNVVFDAGWTTRSAGYLDFDLKLKDPKATEGTFSMDMTYGEPHPKGNYEEVPKMTANCISSYVNAMTINLTGLKGTYKNIYQGRIYDITDQGAKLEITNSCLYGNCNMATGEPFQVMKPIILEIKK